MNIFLQADLVYELRDFKPFFKSVGNYVHTGTGFSRYCFENSTRAYLLTKISQVNLHFSDRILRQKHMKEACKLFTIT